MGLIRMLLWLANFQVSATNEWSYDIDGWRGFCGTSDIPTADERHLRRRSETPLNLGIKKLSVSICWVLSDTSLFVECVVLLVINIIIWLRDECMNGWIS